MAEAASVSSASGACMAFPAMALNSAQNGPELQSLGHYPHKGLRKGPPQPPLVPHGCVRKASWPDRAAVPVHAEVRAFSGVILSEELRRKATRWRRPDRALTELRMPNGRIPVSLSPMRHHTGKLEQKLEKLANASAE